MVNIFKFHLDRFKNMLSGVELELGHVHYVEKGDGWKSAAHAHDVHEFCYVLHGKGTYSVCGRPYEVSPGDLFVAKPGQKHSEKCDPADSFELIILSIKTKKAGRPHPLHNIIRLPTKVPLSSRKSVAGLFKSILDEVVMRKPGHGLKVKASLMLLLTEIYRALNTTAKESSLSKKAGRGLDKKLADDICGYIACHYQEAMGPKEVSSRFHMTPQYLSTFLKKNTGYSPVELLINTRMEAAKRRLAASTDKVVSVARDVGYENPHYFHRLFKKTSGLTPNQYRKRRQNARAL